MSIKYLTTYILGLSFLLLTVSCKSEFEKIRVSGDTDLLYKKAFEYYESGEYQKAQTLFELIIGSFRGKKELEDIYYHYAYTYYNLDKYILASYYFKNFVNTFPNSRYRQEVEFMSAYSNYELSPTYRLDQTSTQKAIDEFQLFVNTYPNSDKVEQSNKLIDEMRLRLEKKAYEQGKLYFDLRQYQAATQSYENLLKDFPETTNAEEIRYMIVRSGFLLAENSIVTKQKERYLDVNKRAEKFLKRFAKSPYWNDVNLINKKSLKKLNSLEDVRYQKQSTRIGSQR